MTATAEHDRASSGTPHSVVSGSDAPAPASAKEARLATIRHLQMLAAAALLLPLLAFAFASFLSYRAAQSLSDERIERSLLSGGARPTLEWTT